MRGQGWAERGAASLEFVLVAASLLVLVMAAVQAGLWWYGRTVVVGAANEGARAASAGGGYATAGQHEARRALDAGLGGLARGARIDIEMGARRVRVRTAAALPSVVPFLSEVPVVAEASARRELVARGGE